MFKRPFLHVSIFATLAIACNDGQFNIMYKLYIFDTTKSKARILLILCAIQHSHGCELISYYYYLQSEFTRHGKNKTDKISEVGTSASR